MIVKSAETSVKSFVFSKWRNTVKKKKKKRQERIGWAQRMFKAVKQLSILLQWWICVFIHVSRPTECPPPRVNLHVNYGLWVTMTC